LEKREITGKEKGEPSIIQGGGYWQTSGKWSGNRGSSRRDLDIARGRMQNRRKVGPCVQASGAVIPRQGKGKEESRNCPVKTKKRGDEEMQAQRYSWERKKGFGNVKEKKSDIEAPIHHNKERGGSTEVIERGTGGTGRHFKTTVFD